MTYKQRIFKLLPDVVIRKYLNYKSRRRMKGFEGSNVTCPACNFSFRIFASYGNPLRHNAKCQYCELAERGRLLWLYMEEKYNWFDGQAKIKLLHFAPEKIFYEKFSKSPNIHYIPCDLFPEKYIFGGKIKVSKIDVTAIPFAENSVDVIICNHVLEHVFDDKLAMRELFRVMKPNGWGIFQVPVDYTRETTHEDHSIKTPQERQRAFGQHDHLRLYGLDYSNRLENAGFKVNVDDYVKKFSNEKNMKYGLDSTELIYHCEKF